jgi:site-specific DNA-methyltransferase (adenine-specific)
VTPYYADDRVTLYHGDSRALLEGGVLGGFGLLLTDPPYGISVTRNGTVGGGGSTAAKYRKWPRSDWDVRQPEVLSLAIECCGAAIVWGGNYYALPPSPCWLVWDKGQRNFSLADAELAWTNLPKAVRVLTIPRSPKLYRNQMHPTAKPVELMDWCLTQAGEPSTVLDPFAGSGTTGIACKSRGIRCVLIEVEERYCEAAARRLSQEVLNLGDAA